MTISHRDLAVAIADHFSTWSGTDELRNLSLHTLVELETYLYERAEGAEEDEAAYPTTFTSAYADQCYAELDEVTAILDEIRK